MGSDEDRYHEAEGEAALDAFRDEVYEDMLNELRAEPVIDYLRRYGDMIETRIFLSTGQASKLVEIRFWGPALVSACTAIELIIGYLILRPLVQGAFLSEEWADILLRRVVSGRPADARSLLPAVLKHWGIDITQVRLSDGQNLWQSLRETVWPRRNNHVHKGGYVDKDVAILGIEVAIELMRTATEALRNAGASRYKDHWRVSGTPEDPFAEQRPIR